MNKFLMREIYSLIKTELSRQNNGGNKLLE